VARKKIAPRAANSEPETRAKQPHARRRRNSAIDKKMGRHLRGNWCIRKANHLKEGPARENRNPRRADRNGAAILRIILHTWTRLSPRAAAIFECTHSRSPSMRKRCRCSDAPVEEALSVPSPGTRGLAESARNEARSQAAHAGQSSDQTSREAMAVEMLTSGSSARIFGAAERLCGALVGHDATGASCRSGKFTHAPGHGQRYRASRVPKKRDREMIRTTRLNCAPIGA